MVSRGSIPVGATTYAPYLRGVFLCMKEQLDTKWTQVLGVALVFKPARRVFSSRYQARHAEGDGTETVGIV